MHKIFLSIAPAAGPRGGTQGRSGAGEGEVGAGADAWAGEGAQVAVGVGVHDAGARVVADVEVLREVAAVEQPAGGHDGADVQRPVPVALVPVAVVHGDLAGQVGVV